MSVRNILEPSLVFARCSLDAIHADINSETGILHKAASACLQFLVNAVTRCEDNQAAFWSHLFDKTGSNREAAIDLVLGTARLSHAAVENRQQQPLLAVVVALFHNCCASRVDPGARSRLVALAGDRAMVSALLRLAGRDRIGGLGPPSGKADEAKSGEEVDDVSEWLFYLFGATFFEG